MFAGLLAVPSSPDALITAQVEKAQRDPRLPVLEMFFEEYDSPVQHLAPDFLEAADEHELDWRLLPSISIIESGGGKAYKNNNIFGWDSCRRSFPTVRQGIHVVASRLANSKLYRDKDLDGILRTYNPREEYAGLVKSVMRKLGPSEGNLDPSLN